MAARRLVSSISGTCSGAAGQPKLGTIMTLMAVSSNEAGDFRSNPRWSANDKIDAVLRLLREWSLKEVSREVGWRRIVLRRRGTTLGVGQAELEDEAALHLQ